MTAASVLLWRHGRTGYNAAGRLQGQVDIPLDEVGTWQVDVAAHDLAHRVTPTRIVASDLGRAVATAQRLADLTGVPVEVDERVRERAFGEWEGLTGEEIHARWPEQFAVWRRGQDPERTGAETREEVARRFASAIEEHAHGLDDAEVLVVVSHGAAITLGLTRLLGLDTDGWRGLVGLHNAHWSLLHPGQAGAVPAWRLGGHNGGPAVAAEAWASGAAREDLPSSTADALRA